MTNSLKRLKYIDIARGIAMFVIVVSHALSVSTHGFFIYRFLFFFNVPLFFILSGMTFKIKSEEKFWEFLKKKFLRIMLPYLVWALVFLIPYFIFGAEVKTELGAKGSLDVWEMIRNVFYGNGTNDALKQNGPLWFLPALFTTEVLYYFVIKMINKISQVSQRRVVEILVGAGLVLIGFLFDWLVKDFYLPWGLNSALTIGVFFYVGYLMKEFKVFENKKLMTNSGLTVLSLGLGILAAVFLPAENIVWADYKYGNYLLCLVAGISFSVLIIQIARLIRENRMIEFVGKNTMNILIFHKIFIVVFQTKLGGFSEMLKSSNLLLEVLLAILVSIVAVAVSILVGKILRKGRA